MLRIILFTVFLSFLQICRSQKAIRMGSDTSYNYDPQAKKMFLGNDGLPIYVGFDSEKIGDRLNVKKWDGNNWILQDSVEIEERDDALIFYLEKLDKIVASRRDRDSIRTYILENGYWNTWAKPLAVNEPIVTNFANNFDDFTTRLFVRHGSENHDEGAVVSRFDYDNATKTFNKASGGYGKKIYFSFNSYLMIHHNQSGFDFLLNQGRSLMFHNGHDWFNTSATPTEFSEYLGILGDEWRNKIYILGTEEYVSETNGKTYEGISIYEFSIKDFKAKKILDRLKLKEEIEGIVGYYFYPYANFLMHPVYKQPTLFVSQKIDEDEFDRNIFYNFILMYNGEKWRAQKVEFKGQFRDVVFDDDGTIYFSAARQFKNRAFEYELYYKIDPFFVLGDEEKLSASPFEIFHQTQSNTQTLSTKGVSTHLTLFDLAGRKVLELPYAEIHELANDDFKAGMYVVALEDEKGRRVSRKVVLR